jgi:hypothetical protein
MMAARIPTPPMVILHSFGLQTNVTLAVPTACGLTALSTSFTCEKVFVEIALSLQQGEMSDNLKEGQEPAHTNKAKGSAISRVQATFDGAVNQFGLPA